MIQYFATSEKRLQLLTGTNPQDKMDEKYVYYAHHREPVMRECLDMVAVCGGRVMEYEWSDFDIDPDMGSVLRHCLRCLRHGKFHRILHQILPQTRSYLFLRVKKDPAAKFDPDLMQPPLSLTKEFRGAEKPGIE